jgi:hypothetical protein
MRGAKRPVCYHPRRGLPVPGPTPPALKSAVITTKQAMTGSSQAIGGPSGNRSASVVVAAALGGHSIVGCPPHSIAPGLIRRVHRRI